MIQLSAATIRTPNGRLILAPTTESFAPFARIGILAAPGSGKTILARALAGIAPIASGKIIRPSGQCTILGQENLLHPAMRLQKALENTAELLGLPPQKAANAAMEFCMTPQGQTVGDLSPIAKSALSFALSLQRETAWLIADDRLIPNDPRLLPRAHAAIERKLDHAGLILISKNATQISKYCSRFFVLTGQQLIPTEGFKAANHLFTRVLEAA